MDSRPTAPPPVLVGGLAQKKQSAAEAKAERDLTAALAKPKRVLVLARYYFSYHEWIPADYAKIVLTDSSNKELFDITVRKKFAEIAFFDNYETNGNVERVAMELHRKYHFTHVIYQAEQDIIRSARLRKAFGLEGTGQSIESALCFRDKVLMKQYISAHMTPRAREILNIPKCERVESALTIIKFVEEHGLPIVVKPTAGMGSMKTYLIHTEEELQKMLAEGVAAQLDGPIDFEVEEFVKGQMYHIDGFVEDGQVKVVWPSVYVNTCASFKESKFLGSHTLDPSNPLTPRLRECAVETLASMNQPKSYSFHVEVFHTPNDQLYLCEAACRTGGAGVAPVTLWLTGVDLNKATIQAQIGDKVTSPLPSSWKEQETPESAYGWIVVYPKVGILESIPTGECPYEQILDYQPTPRRDFNTIEHCTDALASFLVKGKDENEVKEYINKAVDWVLSTCVWK